MTSRELQFDPFEPDLSPTGADALPEAASNAALKKQVADRLAAHRSKRGGNANAKVISLPTLEIEPDTRHLRKTASMSSAKPAAPSAAQSNAKPGKSRANRIAAAVAERYAHSTTYREFLAAEAERAMAEANATAEIAARNAEAVKVVQQQLLTELDLWEDSAPAGEATPDAHVALATRSFLVEWDATASAAVTPQPADQPLVPGLTIRLYEDVGLQQPAPRIAYAAELHEDEAHALNQLDDEIAFRHTPVFDEPASPPVPIPANLIQFPRQLIAARKSRPRIAEGPLREEADAVPAAAQLRIFEVDATQFSTAPTVEPETSLPEWSTIHLDAIPKHPSRTEPLADPAPDPASHIQAQLYVPLQVAPLSHRLMAAAVDACLLGTAFLAAVSAFSYGVKSLPAGPVAAIASAATLLVLYVLYHLLFFTFACATPGMRYARIGLCTFSDDNPTRAEMRRRVWFILLAACPLGLGILWSLLDEDTLGWHDRLSRIYQRSY